MDARVFVNLEFVQDMLKLVNATFNNTEHVTDDHPIVEAELENDLNALDNTAPGNQPIKFKLSCQLNDTEVVLLKDPHRSITPSIIAHVGII